MDIKNFMTQLETIFMTEFEKYLKDKNLKMPEITGLAFFVNSPKSVFTSINLKNGCPDAFKSFIDWAESAAFDLRLEMYARSKMEKIKSDMEENLSTDDEPTMH
jgi:hypothetical protein